MFHLLISLLQMVVSRDGSDLDDELPRVGTKRSVKERLGNQLDSDAVSKRCFLFPSYVYCCIILNFRMNVG